MSELDLIILSVVLIFSVVQSILGMGLLVFGTPTLLLLGLPYSSCLAYLLPASIAISILQVRGDVKIEKNVAREFFTWSIVPLFISLAVVLSLDSNFKISLAVGVLMLATVLIKLSSRVEFLFASNVKNNFHLYLVTMGVIHGVSNLGGSVLSVISSVKYSEKTDVRRFISFCYLWFATIQLVVLFFFHYDKFTYVSLIVPVISSVAYIAIGKSMFKNIDSSKFNNIFVLFMLAYSLLLITKDTQLW
ncbi:TSUP family transporter [Halomonas sp. ISL-60]|uniref:TSUP family transporter n=1 Tax=Halomonas sp. ISL-56 TaxID=2819149 RepID=UPI001BE8D853|nr:TSUP family transporter [Halomonas sp. ISL-56]MBT2772743.1 TSUP family transporter [Halomonas sp. ISL-60]MBT2800538.1 TSUP family transporter [Halomonas sp. ISL-56]